MQHLDLEAMARLVDETPEPHEAEHLRDCLVCRRELAEMRAQTEALADLDGIQPPAGAWSALEARLLDEKLVRTPTRAWGWTVTLHRPPARIAAAVALFLLGGATGAAVWRAAGVDGRVAVDAPAVDAAPARRGQPLAAPEVLYYAEPVAASDVPAAGSGNGARLAMNGAAAERPAAAAVPPERTAPRRATEAEARRAARELVQAQADYVAAMQRVAAIADPASGNAPETRLAALEQLVRLTAAALERVPGDPVINGYHLAAVAERDALRREMDRAASTEWF